MIRFDDVAVTLAGQQVLEVPQLALPPGAVSAIVGDNGAGKSTLLLAAAGLIDLARGAIRLDDELFHRGRAPAPRRLRLQTALVLQEPLLLGRSVEAAVSFGLRARRVPRPQRVERTRQVLERLGLAHLARRGVRELSGGERRLAAFAAAVVVQPRLLLLDEVTAGLDAAAIAHVAAELQALRARQATVLLATHQGDPVRDLAQRTVALRAGRLVD